MTRVLMFAFYFPPLAGGGVQRTLKHVKYLPGHGVEPIVIAGGRRDFTLRDETLTREIPDGTVVVRPRALPLQQAQWKLDGALRRVGLPTRLINQVLWPDELIGWLPGAVWQGLRVARRHGPDVLYSSSSPTTSHLAALIVHRLTGLPWVADFRDAWTLNPVPSSAELYAPLARASAALERRVVAEASFITIVDESVELLGLAHHDPRRVVIRNGIDAGDIPEHAPVADGNGRDRFRLAHVGSLYGSRDARPVIEAVGDLIREQKLDPDEFELKVVGHAGIDRRSLDPVPVTFTGYVEHDRALAEMASASALLFYQPPDCPGSSGKIFEYLASGRPVLCVAEPDNLGYRLVEELGGGPCADVRDVDSVGDAVERLVAGWRREQAARVDPGVREQVIARFSRQRLAGELADVLTRASRTPRSSSSSSGVS